MGAMTLFKVRWREFLGGRANPCWVRVKSTREPAPAMSAGRQRDVRSSALRTWSADDLADPRTADPAQVSLRRDRMLAAGDCSPSQQSELHDRTDGSMAKLSDRTHCPHATAEGSPAEAGRLHATECDLCPEGPHR